MITSFRIKALLWAHSQAFANFLDISYAMADRNVPAQSSGPPASTAASSTEVPKSKARPKKADRVKTEYDLDRSTGPDPRDPRTAGAPCFGSHQIMKPGRGSLSGANAHGRWEVCQNCRLRVLYVPAVGAHAHYRQAGPLPQDTATAVQLHKERVEAGQPPEVEKLNAKNVALQRVEDSLLKKLEHVRAQKAKAASKAGSMSPTPTTTTAATAAAPPAAAATDGYPEGTTTEKQDDKAKGKDRGAKPKAKAAPAVVDSESDGAPMDAENEATRVPKKGAKRDHNKPAEVQGKPDNEQHRRQLAAGVTMNLDEDGFLVNFGRLTESEATAITESMKGVTADIDEVMADIPKAIPNAIDLLEVCCPQDSKLAEAVRERGGHAERIGLRNFDLGTKDGVTGALAQAEALHPRYMWISTPCGPFSPIQTLFNEATDDAKRKSGYKKKRARKVIRAATQLAYAQIARGDHVSWEWPSNNGGWREPEVKKLMDFMARQGILYTTLLDGCMMGVKAPDKDVPMKKQWRIVTTCPCLKRSLSVRCDKSHEHAECLGHARALSSGFYPVKLCKAIAQTVLTSGHESAKLVEDWVYGLQEEPLLQGKLSSEDRKRATALVHRLHVRAGHPSNKLLANVLRARGAHPEVIKIALAHECNDCQEMRLPSLSQSVSLQQSDAPWKVIQIDNAELRVDDKVTHFMVITDEATRYMKVIMLFERDAQEGRNDTADEAILAIEQGWVQSYGFPDRIRLDPEGCFRSRALEDWAADRGVEMTPCPAEAHNQIGQVESLIGKVKQDAVTLLSGMPIGAHRALLHSAGAHNTVHRVQGFSPVQWAFGRDFNPEGRLFETEQGLPFLQNVTAPGHSFYDQMSARQAAEDISRRSQATYQLGRLLNMRTRRSTRFIPGDLVFYRRVQPPADAPAHPGLGFAKVGQGRWFGPARVLASETRTDAQGQERRPAHTVWITANGRLKRCSLEQLRHASDREAAIAEASETVTPTWTFHSLLQQLNPGAYDVYDDHVFPEDIRVRPPRGRSRTPAREEIDGDQPEESRRTRSRTPAPEGRTTGVHPGTDQPEESQRARSRTPGRQPSAERCVRGPDRIGPLRHPSGSTTAPARVDPNTVTTDGPKYLNDPSYDPTLFRFLQDDDEQARQSGGDLQRQPLFKKQKQAHAARSQQGSRPTSTTRTAPAESTSAAQLTESFVAETEEVNQEFFVDVREDEYVMCAVELPIPSKESEWKRLKRDASAWMAKGLRKQEVSYSKLSEEGRRGFDKAKENEVTQWIQEAAAKRIEGHVPRHRVMRMRWVLTYKETGAPKARIVIVGYEDPDITSVVSSSPTMSRRTRQLVFQTAALRSWRTLKADVKSAFLQTAPTQLSRSIFARPVPELAKAMNLKEGQTIQLAKAAYGLINAPAEWHRDINRTLTSLGFIQLRTEPCCWKYVRYENGSPRLLGVVCAHVDDFIITGCEQDPEWVNAVAGFHSRYRFSPWECVNYTHCGVAVREGTNEFVLDQSTYCSQIEEIKFDARNEDDLATKEEITQLRGVLGAVQWRAYSTAPQLLVQLSMLQSMISKATVKTLKLANKLVREAFHNRFQHMRISGLGGIAPEEVNFVAWSDAAVGNRPDFGSTGGYLICATTPSMLLGDVAPVTPVSWRSGRLQRVARSSLAAETQAASEAEEELMLVRLQWREMQGFEIDLRAPGKDISKVPGALVTDAKSLYDVLKKDDLNSAAGGLKEKYSALELLSLAERIRDGQTQVRWVNSDAQVADALTKPTQGASLHQLLASGRWRLVYDPSFTSAKRLKRR